MCALSSREEQGVIWDYYKPRHIHAWNMFVLSWCALEDLDDRDYQGFQVEYCWENFIIRLWLYRTTVKTLAKLPVVTDDAQSALRAFDMVVDANGRNDLRALRNMIEHFDDYAAGEGHGPAERRSDLDPWRSFTKDTYDRGRFHLERGKCYEAANKLRLDAKQVSDKFIQWYK